jgi:hypothetical protein
MHEHVTLLHPDVEPSKSRAISSSFPTDLLVQSAARLRVLALLYAFVFFMAGIFPALLLPSDRARFLGSFVLWGPGVFGIVVALLVAAVIRSPRMSLSTAMSIGLAFEIASSYGIAASIPPALDRLVLSCLAKDPRDRPQSAKELSLRLAEVEGAGPWTQDRARDW